VGLVCSSPAVTVFGFSRSQSESILNEFKNVGELTDCKWGPGESNWVHLQYKDPYLAQRALSRMGIKIGGSMIGVLPCHEKISSLDYMIPQEKQAKYGTKTIRPLLQQPVGELTKHSYNLPQSQNLTSVVIEYIFGVVV